MQELRVMKNKNDHIADYQALYNRVKLILKGDELSENYLRTLVYGNYRMALPMIPR